MGLRKKAQLIIYRFRERGLEVFLLPSEDERAFPDSTSTIANDQIIELEPGKDKEEAFAVEADWHEIPSLKQMLYEDASELKSKLKELEGGTYLTVKDALKQRLSPSQVQFLRELKDVISDRNSVRDL